MKGKKRLFLAMGIYAAVFLVLIAAGLSFLWNYMAAYEASRPKHAADAYIEQLTAEQILRNDPDLAWQLDLELQSRESVLSSIDGLLKEPLSIGRMGAENTYAVRCGEKCIGSFSLREESKGPFGLPVWTVEEENYDLTQFICAPVTVTVPSEDHVVVDDVTLDESYISQQNVPYEVLEPFYGKFDLPVQVTYTVPAVLGEMDIQITDENGAVVPAGSDDQWISALDNCTEEEEERLSEVLQEFLSHYVAFAGSRAGTERGNFSRLSRYLVPNGELVQRFRSALNGLSYGQSRGNELSGWEKNLFARIDDTHYFCDVTYQLAVTGTKGTVNTEENLKVILTEINGKLLVEALDNY